MGLKEEYEADGLGEYVFEGVPEFRADRLAKGAKGTKVEDLKVEDPTPEIEEWRRSAAVAHAIIEGDVTRFLTRWGGEEDDEFTARKLASVYGFVNFYAEAVGGLVDQAFSKPLMLDEDAPPQIVDFWDNVCRGETNRVSGDLFARDAAFKSLGKGGKPYILVDFPVREQEAADAAEEAEQGLGPYFKLIGPWQVLEAKRDADDRLVRLRYRSSRVVSEHAWGDEVRPVIVVLERGEQGGTATRRVFVEDDEGKEFKEEPGLARSFQPPANASAEVLAKFREIPAVRVPTGGLDWPEPVMDNVAYLNVLHYRKRTDYDIAEGIAAQPMGLVLGMSKKEFKEQGGWGAYRIWHTTKSPQDAGYQDISFGFNTAQISLSTLESIERHIDAMSRQPQSQRATGEEKATIRIMDEAKKISRLQAWALGWLEALQSALQWAGWWMGIEDVGELSYLDEVFEALQRQPGWEDVIGFVAAASTAPPSLVPLLVEEAQRHGVLSDTHDAEEVAALVEAAELPEV